MRLCLSPAQDRSSTYEPEIKIQWGKYKIFLKPESKIDNWKQNMYNILIIVNFKMVCIFLNWY